MPQPTSRFWKWARSGQILAVRKSVKAWEWDKIRPPTQPKEAYSERNKSWTNYMSTSLVCLLRRSFHLGCWLITERWDKISQFVSCWDLIYYFSRNCVIPDYIKFNKICWHYQWPVKGNLLPWEEYNSCQRNVCNVSENLFLFWKVAFVKDIFKAAILCMADFSNYRVCLFLTPRKLGFKYNPL